MKIGWGIATIAILGTVFAFAVITGRNGEEKACSGDDQIGAFVMSQSFVTRTLKAPSTAVYPYINDDGVTVGYRGDCAYTVRAYVDAQNSFGAKIRTRYTVDLEFVRGTESQWRATRVEAK